MRRPKVDLNVSEDDFTPSSTPSQDSAPVHNFMPMTPFVLPPHQPTEEDEEEAHSLALMLKQRQLVQSFWEQQKSDIENATTESLRNHLLPLARIKKVMKSREEVKMTTADSPAVFAKACEMFIMELTLRAWLQTEDGKRRTLQRCDIARALRLDELFDFLIDFVPYDCRQDDEAVEIRPANKQHFPGVHVSANFMTPSMIGPKVQQQVMIKPSPSIAEFDYGSTAKTFIPMNPEVPERPKTEPSFAFCDFDYGSTSKEELENPGTYKRPNEPQSEMGSLMMEGYGGRKSC